MAVKVGINGFGRIGRNVLRASLNDPNLEFVAVNDLTDPKTLAHLLKYDSILGNLKQEISAGTDSIKIDGRTIKVFAEKDPAKLPWESVGAQVVLHGALHRRKRCQETHARFSEEGHHLGSRKERRFHRCPRRQSSTLRSGQAPHYF